MKRTSICFLLAVLLAASCKEDRMKYLPGKWRATKFQNHELDSTFATGQAFIDTMGKGHDDTTNIRLYGVANMDSLRKEMQKRHDEALAAQNEQVKNTVFTFQKDGIIIISFGGRIDSSKWTLDNENNMIVETLNPAQPKEILKWKVLNLSEKEMTLRFMQENDSTIVTFNHEEK